MYATMTDRDIVQKLLNSPEEININAQNRAGETALHWIAGGRQDVMVPFHADSEILKLLLADPRINVNIRNFHGSTPLRVARQSLEKIETDKKSSFESIVDAVQEEEPKVKKIIELLVQAGGEE